MNIYVGQIYVEPGVGFPFSHHMQVWLSQQLSALVSQSDGFAEAYGADFSLGIRISARRGTTQNDIKGPTVFKRTTDVEYTIFLPYDVIVRRSDGCRAAAGFILSGVHAILTSAHLNPSELEARRELICDHICTDPAMLKSPWPSPAK